MLYTSNGMEFNNLLTDDLNIAKKEERLKNKNTRREYVVKMMESKMLIYLNYQEKRSK